LAVSQISHKDEGDDDDDDDDNNKDNNKGSITELPCSVYDEVSGSNIGE
jgi:hypothetical protein